MTKVLGSFLRCIVGLVIVGLCACSNPYIQKSEKKNGYEGNAANVLVVIDTSHLAKAFMEVPGSYQANQRHQELSKAINAFSQSIKIKLFAEGVVANVESLDPTADKPAISRFISKYRARQLLILATNQFETSTTVRTGYAPSSTYNGWTGKLSWVMSFFDLDKTASPEGKPVWKANSDLFNFGPWVCKGDDYVGCSDRLASVIVGQMKKDNLIVSK